MNGELFKLTTKLKQTDVELTTVTSRCCKNECFTCEGLFGLEITFCIHAQKNKEKKCESPQRWASVTEEWQRYAYDGCHAEYHTDIDEEVEEEYAYNTVAIDSSEGVGLSFGKDNESPDKEEIE